MRNEIKRQVIANEEVIKEFTQALVKIESVTGNEKKIIEYLHAIMLEMGFDEVMIDEMGNLIGRVGNGEKVLAIDGHVDTVEIGKLEDWKMNPLTGEIKDENLYGRGACDQKGGLAATIIAVKILRQIGFPENLTLYVLASVNEELFEGMNWQHIINNNVIKKPDAVLLTEPSNLELSLGHRGRMDLKIDVKGKSSHGADPDLGENAIYKLLPIVQELEKLHARLPEDPFFGKATLTVTEMKSSSVSLNAVPHSCQLHIDRRLGINDTQESVLKEIKELPAVVNAQAKVYVTESHVRSYKEMEFTIKGFYPSWIMSENDSIVKNAIDAFEQQFEIQPRLMFWRFSTNGVATKGLYDIPTIGFGPGNEEFAHTYEEHVPLEHLFKATEFYTAFCYEFAKKEI